MTDYADFFRGLNVFLTTAVFAGLLWRLIGRHALSFPLAQWVTGLFAALEFILAMGIAYRAKVGGPFNPVQFLITVHCLVALVVIWKWPAMMQKIQVRRDPHPQPPSRRR